MAENQKTVLTEEGLKKLEAQLDYLISVRRNEVSEQIAVARGFGDLSENAEYDEAKKEQAKVEEEIVRATASHGWGHCVDIKPEQEMEKVLFAVDELTGLIGAAALMRPSKSVSDMELKSLKKKFKDKKFAAGCSRDVIAQGAELLGWELDQLLDRTLAAMRAEEAAIEEAAAQG